VRLGLDTEKRGPSLKLCTIALWGATVQERVGNAKTSASCVLPIVEFSGSLVPSSSALSDVHFLFLFSRCFSLNKIKKKFS